MDRPRALLLSVNHEPTKKERFMGDSTHGYAESVRESIDAFNRGDVSGYVSHYTEGSRYLGPFFPEPLVGRDAIEQATIMVSNAFPGMRWNIVSLLADGNRVACELHIEGTHRGPLASPAGEIPATGRAVSFEAVEILEFNEDGLIAETREYMDPGALMAQLGLSGE